MSPLYSLFERAVKKRRLSNRIASGVIFLTALVGVFWGLSASSDPSMARMAALGSICLVVCPLIFAFTFRKSPGLEVLRTPEQIVWFYGVGRGGHVTDVMFGTELGKLHKMPVPSLKESAQAMALVRAAAPLATEGYSEQRRVQFNKQPSSLRVGSGQAS